MKKFKHLVSIFLALTVLFLSACSDKYKNESELVIGVENITGTFNPLYAETETDKIISSQIYATVQRQGTDNSLINYCGGISYEYVGETQVKYTVTLRDDLFFSDGKNVTIDDLIFVYHLISDATYDGVYSDWHLNDIVGLEEFYYDDENYSASVAEIENRLNSEYSAATIAKSDYVNYLTATGLEGKFKGGLDSKAPNGKTWREYFQSIDYTEELEKLGDSPSDTELLRVAARAEAENNPLAYSPEGYYREILFSEYLGTNYSDGADVTSISGIRKVNDYSCTVLFNSRNINGVSQINIPIISKASYEAEYIKGNAALIKEKSANAVGSGPYKMTKNADNEVVLSVNEHYFGGTPDFTSLKFTDLAAAKKDPVDAIKNGEVDIISVTASSSVINSLNAENIKTVVSNQKHYTSVFFNTRTLDVGKRKALAGFCNFNKHLSSEIGPYYTAVYMPLSIRFPEYPSGIISPVYSENTYSNYLALNPDGIKSVTAYCVGKKESLEYRVLEAYKSVLADNGITLTIVVSDYSQLEEAIVTGKADLWIESVPDGATCDKYDYYHSNGSLNKTGVSSPEIDSLTASLRSAVGFSDRDAMIKNLLNAVMEQAVECPLYQLQTVTAYNTDKISPESFGENFNYDGFTYVLPLLKRE